MQKQQKINTKEFVWEEIHRPIEKDETLEFLYIQANQKLKEDVLTTEPKQLEKGFMSPFLAKAKERINHLSQTRICLKINEIKNKIKNFKNKLQEINQDISKKTSIIISKKMIYNFFHYKKFVNHAMIKILLNKELKKHPQRIELVYIMNEAKYYLSSEQTLELLQDESILSSPKLLEIIKLVSQTDYPHCLALAEIAKKLSKENDDNIIEIMQAISRAKDYENIKMAAIIATDFYFSAEDRKKLIMEIVKGDIYTSTLIKSLATEYRELLNSDLLETAKLINLYKCRSKLISAINQMLGENGLLSQDDMRDVSIDTLRHFQAYPEDETEMFSCIELFNKDTDPTYDRELESMIEKLRDMPKEQREVVFDSIRNINSSDRLQISYGEIYLCDNDIISIQKKR